MAVAKGIGDPAVIFSLLIIFLIIASAVIIHRKNWGISFGILWFFVAITPETVFPLNMIVHEHRAYLPEVGFALFCGFFLYSIKGWLQPSAPKRFLWPITIGIFILFISLNAFGTIKRNQVWQEEYTLWKDTFKKYPNLVRPHILVGVAYEKRGLFFEAMEEYKTAASINPKNPEAHDHMGTIYYKFGLMEKALEEYKIAIRLNPSFGEAHNNIGVVYHTMGMLEEAIEHYKAALKWRPAYDIALRNLNMAYAELSATKDKPHAPGESGKPR